MTARIALDAFGGDDRPHTEVRAAVAAARAGANVTLVGDESVLQRELAVAGGGSAVEIHHAPDVIEMDDSPAKAVRGKADASMPVCFDLVRRGDADAVVSAGNSGAMLACGLLRMKRIKGVDRPAILTNLPTHKGVVSMLDMGANTECRAINLIQFAVMGAVYSRIRHGRQKPVVAILSNGAEQTKGTDLTRAAHDVLAASPWEEFEYVGYAEGKDVFAGDVDVVVTDGYTGNIALKMAESAGVFVAKALRRAIEARVLSKLGALLMKPSLAEVRDLADLDRYGGALLVGVDGIAVICHGSAGAKGIATAINQAGRYVDHELTPAVRDAIARSRERTDERDAQAEPA